MGLDDGCLPWTEVRGDATDAPDATYSRSCS